MALVDAGAAEIIEESNLSGAAVIEKADAMLHDEATLAKFSENSKKMAITNANERIYSVVKQVLNLL